MDTVRTTITLPADLHEELRLEAVKRRSSVGELITERFRRKGSKEKKTSTSASALLSLSKKVRKILKKEKLPKDLSSHHNEYAWG